MLSLQDWDFPDFTADVKVICTDATDLKIDALAGLQHHVPAWLRQGQ